ncbi:hypothetical protein CsSME_00053676 [Camellia sinensis var. sinensis]
MSDFVTQTQSIMPRLDVSLASHVLVHRITSSRSIRLYLGGRGKSGWLLETVTQPPADDPKRIQWDIDNCTLLGWLFNSIEEHIYNEALGFTVAKFFRYFQSCWKELAQYEPLSDFPTVAAPIMSACLARQHTYQFLIGLKPEFESLYFQILNTSPMPSLYEAIATIDNEECRRRLIQPVTPLLSFVPASSSVSDQMALASKFSSRASSSKVICHHCGAAGHVQARCFKLHPGLKQRFARTRPSGHPHTAIIADTSSTPQPIHSDLTSKKIFGRGFERDGLYYFGDPNTFPSYHLWPASNYQLTCTYTPEQNGIVEHKNCHIIAPLPDVSLSARLVPIIDSFAPSSSSVSAPESPPPLQTYSRRPRAQPPPLLICLLLLFLAKLKSWVAALQTKMAALEYNHTWDLVSLPSDETTVGCKWVFIVKYLVDGIMDRYKARLVAKSFTQVPGKDFGATFAPVAKLTTIHPPPEFQAKEEYAGKVCRLRKSLYGLKQSPRAWFHRFSSVILSIDFIECHSDHTCFIRHQPNGQCIILLAYVDDIILTGDDSIGIAKDLGLLKYFLGIEVARSHSGIPLSQRKYTLDLLRDTGMIECKPASTPMDPNLKLSTESDYVGSLTDRRSTSGVLHFPWYLSSIMEKQKPSTMAHGTCELLWLWSILTELRFEENNSSKLFRDNKSAILLASDSVLHERTKHIEIDIHFIREKVRAGIVSPSFVPSSDQTADIHQICRTIPTSIFH